MKHWHPFNSICQQINLVGPGIIKRGRQRVQRQISGKCTQELLSLMQEYHIDRTREGPVSATVF